MLDDENLHEVEAVLPEDTKTVVGLQEITRLGPEGEETRLMFPENPPRLVKVTLDVVEEPAANVTEDGFRPMLKSTILIVTLTLWETVPLAPRTVTV